MNNFFLNICKGKDFPQQAEVAQVVPGSFATTRMVVLRPYAPAAFSSGEILGTHF